MLRGSFHFVDVTALSICIVLRAFVYMCLLYVRLGSRVSPSIFGLIFMGSVLLSICSCVLYYDKSGVKKCACCFAWAENEVVCLCPCMYFL